MPAIAVENRYTDFRQAATARSTRFAAITWKPWVQIPKAKAAVPNSYRLLSQQARKAE